jgi:O-antigen/teichoic acid export membrane protein
MAWLKMKFAFNIQASSFLLLNSSALPTGLAFQYMIARSTNPQQYGVWFNVNDVLAYFTILAGILPFWAMRFVARNERGAAKTGVLANLAISIAATLVYLPLLPLITSALQRARIHKHIPTHTRHK